MCRASAYSLSVVLAAICHLVVVDRGDLWIPLSSCLRSQKRELLHQAWTGLGDRQAFGFTSTTLAAARDHPAPTSEGSMIWKALRITDETEVDGCSILAHTIQGFKISAWVQLTIEWSDSPQLQLLMFRFQRGQQSLLAADLRLQIIVVQEGCLRSI
jgi:hypothetical protein